MKINVRVIETRRTQTNNCIKILKFMYTKLSPINGNVCACTHKMREENVFFKWHYTYGGDRLPYTIINVL